MHQSEHMNTAPMKLHGAALSDYAIERIDEGLEAVEKMTIEHSLGHACMKGLMDAQMVYDCLGAYERAFNLQSDYDDAA